MPIILDHAAFLQSTEDAHIPFACPAPVASMRPSLKIGDSGCKRPSLRREEKHGVVKLDMDSGSQRVRAYDMTALSLGDTRRIHCWLRVMTIRKEKIKRATLGAVCIYKSVLYIRT